MEFGLVVLWVGAFLGIGLAALPLTTWLFGRPSGAGLSVVVGLAVLTVVGHLVGHVAFGWPAALAGLLALLVASSLARRRVAVDWRAVGEPAAVFLAGFALIVLVRGFDPAAAPLPLAIGEKFLDFGLLAALDRAPRLPPEDFWFAGQPVRYHYVGHVAVSLVATLTATPPRFAYNLGLAGVYATLVTTAYTLAGQIATAAGTSRRPAALLGAFFVGVAGNLETPARIVLWVLPGGTARWLVRAAGLEPSVAAWTPGDFHYFDASRVVPVDPSAADTFLSASEFPLFAWVNGDLHAHMLSQPFVLLVAALLFAYWRAEDPSRQALVLFGAVPPVAGLVGSVNVWSLPTVWGLAVLAVVLRPGDPAAVLSGHVGGERLLGPRERWVTEELRRVGLGLVLGTAVVGVGLVWTLPFWVLVAAGGPGQSLAYWAPWSPLGSLLLVHGVFLLATVPALALRAAGTTDAPYRDALLVLAVTFAVVGVAPAVALFVPLVAGGWWLVRTRDDVGFEALLVVAAAGLVVLVEVVTIPGERFNVIFKPYADLWLFFAVASGVVLARLLEGWPGSVSGPDPETVRTAGRGLVAALVVLSGVWAVLAIPGHVQTASPTADAEGPTLDATAYLDHQYPEEAPAIRWLNDRDGRPTVVTAAPAGYWWSYARDEGASAPASLTGLPTVLGWFHESQYRGEAAYRERLGHVRTIYRGAPTRQRTLLATYDVQYVYVGPVERSRYDVTVGDLEAVDTARRWDHVTVYRVDQSAL